ncbi:MAG: magnesium transporter [Eubacteriaceae bacterium]|nr:magnesium transporter [Eubacteriaceae bacterium]
MDKEIAILLKEPGRNSLRQILESTNTVDLADELEKLDGQDVIIVFRMLSKVKAAEVFAHLDHSVQQAIIKAITDREIKVIIDELFLDDAVDFIDEMPADVVKRVLSNVTAETRILINQFLQYPEDSAGSLMTIEYVDLKSNMNVADAFKHIRSTGTDKETIYTCYVTDNARRLIGVVSARTLFLADKTQLIRDIMKTDFVFATTHDTRDELLSSFRELSFLAIPVVDNEGILVGIVTFDDLLVVQEEEATEDFEKMAAMSPSEEPYLKSSALLMAKNRMPWLVFLNFSVFITGAIVARYENIIAALPVIVSFLPMLMDTSGDAGSQSSTIIIRALAIEEIKISDFWAVLWKEIRVALFCGVVLAIINYIRVVLLGYDANIALIVSAALFTATFLAKTFGALLPLCAVLLKLDPAVMAVPILTTIVDASTLVVYFNLAKLIMHN